MLVDHLPATVNSTENARTAGPHGALQTALIIVRLPVQAPRNGDITTNNNLKVRNVATESRTGALESNPALIPQLPDTPHFKRP